MRWILSFVIMLVVLAVLPVSVRADSDVLPDSMQGVWSLPDCGEPMDMVIYTPRYVLSVTEEEACLQFVKNVREGAGYNLVETDFETFLSRRTNDGLLEEVYPEDPDNVDITARWDDIAVGQRFEYAHCESPATQWYVLHGPGIIAMEHIDRIVALCADGVDATCREALFSVVDDDGNNVLQGFEIAYASQIAAYFASINHQGGNQTQELTEAMQTAKKRAPRFAERVLAAADFDRSGDLTLQEITDFWTSAPNDETIAQVNYILVDLSDVFPFIQPMSYARKGAVGDNR